MAASFVSTGKWKTLVAQMALLNIRDEDIDEQFVRAKGHGGQNVNKVSTCVILTHHPTGLIIRCQEERTQGMNRYRARKRLADKVDEIQKGAASRRQQAIEKIRRQKRRRSKRAKEKMLQGKHYQADIKKKRGQVKPVRIDEPLN